MEYGGQIFNAHPLDVFGRSGQVIKQHRRPSVAMNFQSCYVGFLRTLYAKSPLTPLFLRGELKEMVRRYVIRLSADTVRTARRGIAALREQLAIL